MSKKTVMVTGGAGFIGSAFIRMLVPEDTYRVVGVDMLTYAGDQKRFEDVKRQFRFYPTDIRDARGMYRICYTDRPNIIVHFAAESHVDRSISDSSAFIDTNVKGTQMLLDMARKNNVSKFIHISTDEVYGDIEVGKFKEDSPIKASSPYAASKAAGDLLVQSYIRTHNFPAIIVRPSNNYGPWQHAEKLIPLAISKIMSGNKVPIYGNGLQVREWLYVDDCVRGIKEIMERGKIGEIYNLGSGQESTNLDTVMMLLDALGSSRDNIEHVEDRPGHDVRYSLDSDKISWELDWRASTKLSDGIKLTADWYLKHSDWKS